MASLDVSALIVAAGRGARMGLEQPKQYAQVAGRSVLARCLGAIAAHPMMRRIVIVIHADDAAACQSAIAEAGLAASSLIAVCHGGDARQNSVHNGLKKLREMGADSAGTVLIHDAARPFVSESLLTRAIAAGLEHEAAIPVLPMTDTIAEINGSGDVIANPDRARLRAVQTPQVFRLGAILDAHEAAAAGNRIDFTDDASLILWRGGSVATFEGEANAFKLTTPADMARAEALCAPALQDIRSSTGYDVHVFGPGDHIMLGGVRIPHDQGVIGHSDADVLLHALTDALLGCIADGDIGMHFPPSDMRWKGAASHIFLAEAVRRVRALSGEIRHLDGTIVCESPRVGPHRDAIRACIAAIAAIDISRVSIKATTSEKLGFTGRREGIAALATATIALP